MSDVMEKAERLGRRRARMSLIVGLLLVAQQASYIALWGRSPGQALRLVDKVYIGGWVFLALACLFTLLTGGGYGYGSEVRKLVNDESTLANRAAAVRLGFAAAILAAIVLFVLASLEPTDARTAVHVVVTCGLAAGLLKFARLERRAYRDA